MKDQDKLTNRMLSEALGFEVRKLTNDDAYCYILLAPNGQSAGALCRTEQDAWEDAPDWRGMGWEYSVEYENIGPDRSVTICMARRLPEPDVTSQTVADHEEDQGWVEQPSQVTTGASTVPIINAVNYGMLKTHRLYMRVGGERIMSITRNSAERNWAVRLRNGGEQSLQDGDLVLAQMIEE